MAKFRSSSFSACLWAKKQSRSTIRKKKRKERDQNPAILAEQAWLIEDLLYGSRGNSCCETQRVVQSGQAGERHRSQSQRRI